MSKGELSVTLTREDMIDDLLPVLVECTKDQVETMLKNPHYHMGTPPISPKLHGLLCGLPERDEDLISWWCDCYSEIFFKKHPKVQNVLFLKKSKARGDLTDEKEWIASR